MIYRRRIKSDVWHWITSCRWWPEFWDHVDHPFKEQQRKPKSGELCNECKAKAKRHG